MIEVGDSGPGVPPALHQTVFDDGFTTKPATANATAGSGSRSCIASCARQGGTCVGIEAGASRPSSGSSCPVRRSEGGAGDAA